MLRFRTCLSMRSPLQRDAVGGLYIFRVKRLVWVFLWGCSSIKMLSAVVGRVCGWAAWVVCSRVAGMDVGFVVYDVCPCSTAGVRFLSGKVSAECCSVSEKSEARFVRYDRQFHCCRSSEVGGADASLSWFGSDLEGYGGMGRFVPVVGCGEMFGFFVGFGFGFLHGVEA